MAKANFLAGTVAALLLAGLPAAAQADETADSDWSWRVAPMYVWAPSIKTDLKFDQPPVPRTSRFGDIHNGFKLTGHTVR